MNQLKVNLPDVKSDKRYMECVRKKAHLAILLDLKEFDWNLLSPAAARKIHGMLPPER